MGIWSYTTRNAKRLCSVGVWSQVLRITSSYPEMRRNRYFLNRMPDYQGGPVNIPYPEWKSTIVDAIEEVRNGQPPSAQEDGGLYVGSAGIAYMFYHVAQNPAFAHEKGELLKSGLDYLNVSLARANATEHDKFERTAFLLGNLGAYAVAAAYYHALGQTEEVQHFVNIYVSTASYCKPLNFQRNGGDELFVGRAGFLAGAVFLEKRLGKGVVPAEAIWDICDALVTSGVQYSKAHKSRIPLMYAYYNEEYIGAAHGVSSILQMLLCFPEYLKSKPQAEALVRSSVDGLLQFQTQSGNFPAVTGDTSEELVHWCHGAAGVVYLMAKAYLYWKDDKYLHSCIKCGDLVWERGLLTKGPGICHGVAGSGYVFLLLFRLTGDETYLHRAKAFAEFIFFPEFKRGARTPDRPFSLFEGYAGTVCFLSDLLYPQNAEFPFFDVF